MKKFLSLVLALVMTMSLVTISAGAKDFTDDSKIQYEEAVDVVSALDIVDGYTDGSFNPSATLSRGAAAKIICNMILGPTTASALVADTAPYSDVPSNHVFAGYIAFCAKEGIISGYADGTFRPAATLTSYAFMKMLLGALGYDSEIEQYVGANWSINVAKRALNIGLDDGLEGDFNGVKPVTREEACLYAFNTLTADMVEYDSKTTVNVSGATVVVGGGEASKIKYSDNKDYRESIRTDSTKEDGYQQFCEAYFDKLKLKDVSGVVDAFGRPANTWYKKSDKIGTYKKDADLTYTKNVKGEDIFKDLGLDKKDAYRFDVVVDGLEYANAINVTKSNDTKLSAATGDTVGTGSLVEVFKDERIVTVINTYIMKVDGEYDEDDEELDLDYIGNDGLVDPSSVLTRSFALPLSSDDISGLEDFKDEQVVIVTAAYNTNTTDYDVQTIDVPEVVTATVTEYVDDDTVTAGGNEYKYNVTANADDANNNYQYAIKEEAKLYLDAYGNVLWAEGVEAEGNYLYISEFGTYGLSTNGKVLAYAYFLDGTEDEITLNKIDSKKLDVSTVLSGSVQDVNGTTRNTGWYKFSEKDTGKYDLTPVTNVGITARPVGAEDIITDYASQKTDLGTGAYYGNKATKFIILDDDGDVKVYEGIKNAPKTVVGSGYTAEAVLDSGTSYAKYVFIDVTPTGYVKGGSNSGDKIYILKADGTYGTDVDDDTYYRYKAIVNGEEKKIKIDGTTDYNFGLYTSVEYNSKGYVVDMDLVTTDDDFAADSVGGRTVDYKNNTIVLSDGTNYYLADDYTIFLITDKDTVKKVSASKLENEYETTAFTAGSMIHAIKNADDEVTALYVNVR